MMARMLVQGNALRVFENAAKKFEKSSDGDKAKEKSKMDANFVKCFQAVAP